MQQLFNETEKKLKMLFFAENNKIFLLFGGKLIFKLLCPFETRFLLHFHNLR